MNADPFAQLVELVAQRTADVVLERLQKVSPERGPTSAPLLSKQALAAALVISPAGVDRLVAKGSIPFVRVGDVKRFDLAAVRASLEIKVRSADSDSAASSSTNVRRLTR